MLFSDRGCFLDLYFLLWQIRRSELLSVEGNFGDAHCRETLPVAAQLFVLLFALVVKYEDFFGASLAHNFAGDMRVGLGAGDLALLTRNRQHVTEINLSVGSAGQSLHANYIAGRHPVLFASGANNRVHSCASIQFHTGARCGAIRNLLIFLCLLFSASALSATIADDPRMGSQIQANSTILAWLVEKRQTGCVALFEL